jgi:poly(3-hydroxybutyrate) depolymerase
MRIVDTVDLFAFVFLYRLLPQQRIVAPAEKTLAPTARLLVRDLAGTHNRGRFVKCFSWLLHGDCLRVKTAGMQKYFFTALFSLLLSGGCAIPQSQNTRAWQRCETDPATGRRYYLFVPDTYNHDTPAPVIVSCHGTPPFDIADHHVKMWKKLGEDNGCIIVAPTLMGTDGLLGDGPVIAMLANERFILSIISQLGYRYNIDRANIMITGFSGGGFPTYWVGLRHPDVFSTVVAQNCNFSRHNLHGWYSPEARQTSVMVYYGSNDPFSIALQSRWAIDYLLEQGFRVEARIVGGVGHQRRPDVAMEFFRRHWRKPKPSATSTR